MLKNIPKTYIVIIVALLAVSAAVFIKNKPADNSGGQTRPSPSPSAASQPSVSPTPTDAGNPLSVNEKEQLLADLKSAAEKEDYSAFADLLKKVYDKGWEQEKDFESAESEAYKKADKNYFTAGNYDKALEVSTIVYAKAPSGWRFRYLRTITLEKLGRIALEKGDLAGAEENALTILKMMFRPEGANLLADVYIRKINADISAKDKTKAESDLNYIWDFEASQDRRDTLTDLKNKINNL